MSASPVRGEEIGMLRAVRLAGPGSEFLADDEPVDLVVEGGRIADIAPTGTLAPRGRVLDAGGAWAVPGLWDNHVHTVQWALAAEQTALGSARSPQEAAALMSLAEPLADGRRVGSGFRDALWPGRPSLEILDAATGDIPTYLINSDVHSVWLNSAALRREGYEAADGMLREDDAFEISRRINAVDPERADAAVIRSGDRAAARGVTGLVDFDMGWNAEAWPRRVAAGFAAHRVEFAIYASDLERARGEGLRTGAESAGTHGLVHVGPLKVIVDGSLGTRTAACSHPYPEGSGNLGVLNVDPASLTRTLVRATGAGLEVALHAIGDRALSVALDAIVAADAHGTIEHAQLVRHADLARLARLGVAASIQPQHALDDRDLVESYWGAQSAIGYPMSSLLRAGVELRFGSDAPVAPLDPWQAVAAAVFRTEDERDPWRPEERVSVAEALRASVRTALRPGEPADIAVCGADPHTAPSDELRRMPVQATVLAGRITHAD